MQQTYSDFVTFQFYISTIIMLLLKGGGICDQEVFQF